MLDLSHYRLAEPVNDQGQLTGKARQIDPPDTQTWLSPYFRTSQVDDTITFTCPDGGAATATAHYARSELRDLREWTIHDHTVDIVTLSVDKLGEGQKVVVQQIHDADEPWVKIAYTHKSTGGLLRALIKIRDGADDTVVNLLHGLNLGDKITVKIEHVPASGIHCEHLKITANGTYTNTAMHRTGKTKAYYKRGNYYQCNDRKGAICIVTHH